MAGGAPPSGPGGPGLQLPPAVIQQLLAALQQGGGLGGAAAPAAAPAAAVAQGSAIPPVATQPLTPLVQPPPQLPRGQALQPNQGVLQAPPAPANPVNPTASPARAQAATDSQSTWQQDFINHVGQTTGQYVNPATLGLTTPQQANAWLSANGYSSMPGGSPAGGSSTGGLY